MNARDLRTYEEKNTPPHRKYVFCTENSFFLSIHMFIATHLIRYLSEVKTKENEPKRLISNNCIHYHMTV
jgi:hypothetical protein